MNEIDIPNLRYYCRYHGLLSVHDSLRDSRAICQELCASVCGEPCDGIQFGVSVVFMRANEVFV